MMTASIAFNETKIIQDYGRSSLEFIKQLFYWISHAETKKKSIGILKDGKRWIYNTNDKWAKQIGYSERQTQRTISQLIMDGILLKDKHSRYGKAPINMLTINNQKVAELGLYATTKTMDAPRTVKNNKLSQSPTLCENLEGNTGSADHKENHLPTNTAVQDMLAIWNTQLPQNQAAMTKEYGKFLYAAFTRSFNQEIKQWEDYCSFLSKSHPKGISLDAALKFYTINSYKNKPAQSSSKTSSHSFTGYIASEQLTSFTLSDSDVDTTQSQEMLDIWNRIFGEKKSITTMTSTLSILLAQSFKENFKSNLNEWKSYCLSIESSPYLMASSFILRISTVLKKEFIDKINAKELGVQTIIIPQTRYENVVDAHISKMKETDHPVLNQARKFFIKEYGAAAYKSWIMQVDLNFINGELVLTSGTPFIRDSLKRDYGNIFEYVKFNASKIQNQIVTTQNPSQENDYPKEDMFQINITEELPNQKDSDHTIEKKLTFDDSDLCVEDNRNDDPLIITSNQDAIHRPPIEEGRWRDKPDRPIYHQQFTTTSRTPIPLLTEDNKSKMILEHPKPKDTNKTSLGNNTNEISYNNIEVQDLLKDSTTKNPQIGGEQPRHNSFQNVVDGGGQPRHEGGDYIRTRLPNQHNNNLIRSKQPHNNRWKLNQSSSQQVRYYYLKNYYLKNEIQTEASKIKNTIRVFGLKQKDINLNRKSLDKPIKIRQKKWKQSLKSEFITIRRSKKSSVERNLIVKNIRSCNISQDKLKNFNQKIGRSTKMYEIFTQNFITQACVSHLHYLLRVQEDSKESLRGRITRLDNYLSQDISMCAENMNIIDHFPDIRRGVKKETVPLILGTFICVKSTKQSFSTFQTC